MGRQEGVEYDTHCTGILYDCGQASGQVRCWVGKRQSGWVGKMLGSGQEQEEVGRQAAGQETRQHAFGQQVRDDAAGGEETG